LFTKETNAIIRIYDGAKSISSSLPTVEKVDESLLEKLEGDDIGNGKEKEKDEDDQIDIEAPEEKLLGTNKNLFLNTNNSLLFSKETKNEDKSGSSESSEGGEQDDSNNFIDLFNSMPKTVFSNQPQKHSNPFHTDERTEPTPSTGGSFFTIPNGNNTYPFGGGQTTSSPFGNGGINNSSPFGGGQTTSSPFGGGQTTSSPFGNGGTSLFGQPIFGNPTVDSTNNDPFQNLLENSKNPPPLKTSKNPFDSFEQTPQNNQFGNPFQQTNQTQQTQQKKTNNPFV
jgi:hypothetical protein